MTGDIPLAQARRIVTQRPTVQGARAAWLAMEGPTHAPSLAYKPLPRREWAVEDLIPTKAVCLFSGDGGSGKSTLALQLACTTVLGKPWLGHQTRQGKVAYVSCEDDLAELHIRLAAICDGEGWDMADLDGLELFDRVGRESFILERGEGFGAPWDDTTYWVSFSNWLRDFGPALVVLDSLYDFFSANQLDQSAARQFMGRLNELAHDVACAILVLSHPSQSGMTSGEGSSGSVAFRNKARAMLYLEKTDKEDMTAPLTLRAKKANRGPLASDLNVKWENGRFVVVRPDGSPSGFFGACARRDAEQAFLNCLDAATKQGRFVSPSKGANYAPKVFAGMAQGAGYKVNDLNRAMEALLAAEKIENGPVGFYGNRNPRMGLRRKATAQAETVQ